MVTDPANPTKEEEDAINLWHEECKALLKHQTILNDNIQQAYCIILGECIDLLQAKLKQQTDWETVSTNQDGIALIKLIKNIVYWFEDQKFYPWPCIMPR